MSKTSEMVREMFGKGDAERDAGLRTPEDITRFDDIAYGSDPKYQLLDVYRPKGAEGPLPVIISVHGGGWVYGDKEVYQFYCMSLAERGFAVVNFSYRLAPEHKFPASLEDTNSVCAWVMENAEKYGFKLQPWVENKLKIAYTNLGIKSPSYDEWVQSLYEDVKKKEKITK